MHGIVSGSLPIGYCAKCLPSFKERLKYSIDSVDYVYSRQLPGRKSKCAKCGHRARLYYPVALRVSQLKKEDI